MNYDVIVIGAGAAGMMCAITAASRNKRVLLLEKTNKVGKKILMSGGGRCNFTNLNIGFDNYLSHNSHFYKSALSRYTQHDFIKLVETHQIPYFEKTLGQLFCEGKSKAIVEMLLKECENHHVTIQLNTSISNIKHLNDNYLIKTSQESYCGKSLVIATGGLSIPTLGSSPFGYQVATQFGHHVYPTRAGLVPFTLHKEDKEKFSELPGVSVLADISTLHGPTFTENILFTHRGLSGPAILQASSYWQPGESITIRLRPDIQLADIINDACTEHPKVHLSRLLSAYYPKKMLPAFVSRTMLERPLNQLKPSDIREVTACLQSWQCTPNATEGYRTAEVTLGGVDCNEISSKTFESQFQPGLYFIGEVLDVTGWLGGYNFQWAWSSAVACGQHC